MLASGELKMAIAPWSCYRYDTVLNADREGNWAGVADDDGSASLLGSAPSVVVINGRVTMTRRQREILKQTEVSRTSFDGGETLKALLRQGDRLACWRGGTGEIGLSVSRAGSLVLGLGTLGHTPGSDVAIDHDPRVEERALACKIRYIDRPGTHIVWLDPDRPSDVEAHLRKLDGALPGVNVLAIVVRTDDDAVSLELNRRTMGCRRPGLGATVFLRASKRFSGVEEWFSTAALCRQSDRVICGSESGAARASAWFQKGRPPLSMAGSCTCFESTSLECPGGCHNWVL